MSVATETELLGDRPLSALRVKGVILEITEGPDRGRCQRLDRPSLSVGAGFEADIRLTDAAVSRRHLQLRLSPDGVHLQDEGSTNGTWLGGVRIESVLITSDTVVQIGETKLLFRISAMDLELPLAEASTFGRAIGESAVMRHVFAVLERTAGSDISLLLEGESGTGKGVLARQVHERSPRRAGPWVTVDCGSMPASLIESELFGCEAGAYTGAETGRKGLFEQADGGTLFLDEIGELPPELQPKLLRVLEDREVRRLGSQEAPKRVDVRVIAATNRRLSEAVHKDEFRRDLFYRLAVGRVTVPPLRERREDILPLATRFLREVLDDERAELPADFAAMLGSYSWPGNVRELRNVVQRHALLGLRAAGDLFDHESSAPGASEDGAHFSGLGLYPYREARRIALDRFEKNYLSQVMERAEGVVSRAAVLAEVARPSFYRMLNRANGQGDGEDEGE